MNKIAAFIYFFFFSLIAKSQTADFTYSTTNGLFCNPSTIQFTQTATGNPTGFVWDFGNNSGTNEPNPTITFNKAGSYTVKLVVIYGQRTASITKTVVINPSITASIGYDRNYICKPGSVNFSAASNGNINSYSWGFGDGTSNVTSNNSIAHNFGSPGTYNVTLLATDVSGCFDTTSTAIIVQPPTISGNASPSSGCIPASVSFTANASIPVNSSVSNYAWNFGDGSPLVSTNANTTNHVYTTTGNFSPTVTVTTTEGCTNIYTFQGIAYGTPPINLVAYPVQPVVCGSDTARFVSKATNANSYYWDFGDDSTLHLSDTIAAHKYNTLGIKNVKVTPDYSGCPGNSGSVQINVIGVIAKYTYSNTCTDRKTFSFINTSQGNLSTISWDFGDGSPVVNTVNATHTFPVTGSFLTRLTVKDTVTGCTDTYSQVIYTAEPTLINLDSSICRNSKTTFSVINSFNNPLTKYAWNVLAYPTGNLSDSSYTIMASKFGNFSNYVIILNGSQYCYDTVRLNHTILVKGPDISFTSPSSICLNNLYNITNSSKPFLPADSINTWYWNFGVTSINDSVYQPQPYLYNSAGNYNVQLTGIDKNGCKDSLIKPVIVNPLPFLYVIPAIDTLCSGTADTLLAFHNGTIQWTPSNSLNCSTCDTVLTNASANTTYYITATSQFGCITKDSIIVKVYPPFTAVAPLSDVYVCLNDTVHLNVGPMGERIVWTPTAGLSSPNNYGPIVSPNQNTTYTATLTDSVGCFTSSASINVHVKSLPTVEAGPDQFYPFNSSFTINPKYSNNVSSYNWTPSGPLSCTNCPNPSGVATKSTTFHITVTSDSGCVAKDSVRISVECKDSYLRMPNAFTPNHDNLNDYFYPLTIGVQSIIRFSIYDRFGNLVFEARNFAPNDKTFGWDGRVRGADGSTAVFVYYLEALCDSGEKLYKKGSVVLIR
jgi:gliding motility-associated-like protein